LRFRNVGLIAKQGEARVADTVRLISARLSALDVRVYLDATAAQLLDTATACSTKDIGDHCEVAIVIGGDGSLLGAARALAPYQIPLIGVNLGRLGFLVDVPPDDDLCVLEAMLGGEHITEHRFLLRAELWRDKRRIFRERALNDVVLRIRELVRLIEFETHINGRFVSLQRADGMIAASPTGSTAYSLSCGGPVLTPDMQAILLLPICSHTFSSRPIVLSADSIVELVLRDDNREAAQLVCDGQVSFPLENGDVIRIRRSHEGVTLLHPTSYNFYGLLREKLGWG